MKYLCLFIVFVFYSCASTSYKPIEQFLIEEMKKENKKKFVLISQKKPFLAFYYIYKGIPVPNKPFSDEKQQLSDEIYKKYKNEREKKRWRKNDFKKIDFDIVGIDTIKKYLGDLKSKYKINDTLTWNDYGDIYFLSDIYYYNHKKNMFFNIEKGSTTRLFNDIIIMKKEKDKWIIEKRIEGF